MKTKNEVIMKWFTPIKRNNSIKQKLLMFFFVLFVCAFSQCTKQLCTPHQAFGEMRKAKITKVDAQKLFSKISEYLGAYVFYDIIKSPPQPSGHPDYHKPFDVEAEITIINNFILNSGDSFPILDLFVKIHKLVASPKDLHLGINFYPNVTNHKLGDYLVINPCTFSIKNNQVFVKVPKTIGGLSPDYYFDDNFIHFLKSRENVELIEINNENAIQFIKNYADKYYKMKNVNSAVTLLKNSFTLSAYSIFAFKEEDLNFTFKFKDESMKNFTSVFFDTKKKALKFEKFTTAYNKLQNNNLKQNNLPHNDLLMSSNFINNEDFTDYINLNGNIKKESPSDLFIYSIPKVLSCGQRNVNNQKMYFLVINSFYTPNQSEYIETFDKCKKLFDESTDPIVIILQRNPGGFVDLESYLQDSLAPYRLSKVHVASRIDDSTEKAIRNGIGSSFLNPKTRERRVPQQREPYEGDLGTWYDDPIEDWFNESQFMRTQKSIFEKKYEQKSTMTNVRDQK
ncbi:hypothetical protein EIN_290210, partial [Entamoeba invadens IP1]